MVLFFAIRYKFTPLGVGGGEEVGQRARAQHEAA